MRGVGVSLDHETKFPLEGQGPFHIPNNKVDLTEDSGIAHADDFAIPPTLTTAESQLAVPVSTTPSAPGQERAAPRRRLHGDTEPDIPPTLVMPMIVPSS